MNKNIKLKIFDRKKYIESIKKLQLRKAPSYIIEAYKSGFANVVNEYYRIKLNKKSLNESKQSKLAHVDVFNEYEGINIGFIAEALKKRDEEFLKAFYVMTNLDIITGNKLPPSTGRLLRDKGIYSMDFKSIFKKIK